MCIIRTGREGEEGELLAVGGGKDVVAHGGKRGFCGVVGAKTVLGR